MIIAIFADNACGLCTEYKWLKTNLLAIEILITIRRFEILTDRILVFSSTPFLRDCTRTFLTYLIHNRSINTSVYSYTRQILFMPPLLPPFRLDLMVTYTSLPPLPTISKCKQTNR